MSSEFWHEFCGHGENFTTWRDGDFGHCFEQIVTVCPSYVILTIFSAYYIAAAKRNSRGAEFPLPWFVKYRLLCTICLSITAILSVTLTRVLTKLIVSYADIVTSCIVAFTWLLHSVYVQRLKYLYWSSWRGASSVLVIFLLPLASLGVQLHTTIHQRINHAATHNSIEEYCIYVATFLLLSYVVTLIPWVERVTLIDEDVYYRAINESVDETSSLTDRPVGSYRSITQPQEEQVIAEHNVNCLSRLTFHWAQQLLAKGSRKSISYVNDLFLLPKRLNTYSIFKKFTTLLTGKCDTKFPRSSSSTSNLNSNTNSLPEVSFSGSRQNNRGRNNNESDPQSMSLFVALNKAFGVEYYCLGILKLLADCLGFAGPILLNLLVSYMEKKTEPEQNGYWYAAGLFLSTLLGSFCSTQFDYNCSIVGNKIRTAIITTIYRKSLSVSSVSVKAFSSGQIINFMSTDTDRIVNFCPSFHAFWSLPFQIAVSLYLLHQQVSL